MNWCAIMLHAFLRRPVETLANAFGRMQNVIGNFPVINVLFCLSDICMSISQHTFRVTYVSGNNESLTQLLFWFVCVCVCVCVHLCVCVLDGRKKCTATKMKEPKSNSGGQKNCILFIITIVWEHRLGYQNETSQRIFYFHHSNWWVKIHLQFFSSRRLVMRLLFFFSLLPYLWIPIYFIHHSTVCGQFI